nr:GNAT family N-acetyltransferase [Shewanella sp. SR44-3]
MEPQAEVKHLAAEHKFVILINDEQAHLEYQISADTINFSSTLVPPALRGKGLAERLVRHGLAWAKTQNLQIHASCSYVQKFLKT